MDDAQKLLQAYDSHQKHFAMVNDNFFKRVHVLMAAAEAGVVALAIGTTTKAIGLEATPVELFMTVAAFSLAGLLLAILWLVLGTRQMQALELSKRHLRHLEREARKAGIPLGANLFEGFVAHPPKDKCKKASLGVTFIADPPHGILSFGDEKFPSEDDSWRFKRWTVQAGVAPLETNLSLGFAVLWIVAAVISVISLLLNKQPYVATGVILLLIGCFPFAFALLVRSRKAKACWRAFAAIFGLAGLPLFCSGIPLTW